MTDFVSGYRKFWNEKNKSEDLKMKFESIMKDPNDEVNDSSDNENEIDIFNNKLDDLKKEKVYHINVTKEEAEKINKKTKLNLKNQKKKEKVVKKLKKSLAPKFESTTDWEVKELPGNFDLETIFDDMEDDLRTKIKTKFEKLSKNDSPKVKKRKVKSIKDYKPDLSLKSQKRLKPEIDEALDEISGRGNDEPKKIKKRNTEIASKPLPEIDPTSFTPITPTNLKTHIPDLNINNEAMDDDISAEQRATITEAFQDDDFVEDFQKEKQDEIDRNKPKDIDLTLPGWGSWGGTDIKKVSKKRFILKMPKEVPRKDDNKGDLIIKEHKDVKVKAHQVSEVPFPFNSVKDFEASIRAPLGNTFVPEMAYRRLIKPSMVVKTGAIIQPMDENQLVLHKIKRLKKGKSK